MLFSTFIRCFLATLVFVVDLSSISQSALIIVSLTDVELLVCVRPDASLFFVLALKLNEEITGLEFFKAVSSSSLLLEMFLGEDAESSMTKRAGAGGGGDEVGPGEAESEEKEDEDAGEDVERGEPIADEQLDELDDVVGVFGEVDRDEAAAVAATPVVDVALVAC
jgi:hypothetical protein